MNIKIQNRKIGVNEPCPCGSGKKYKKCCKMLGTFPKAYLSQGEHDLFYEIWLGLLSFVNEQKKIIKTTNKLLTLDNLPPVAAYEIRTELWNYPDFINDYLMTTMLSEEKIYILKSWREHYLKGLFIVAEYKPEHTLLKHMDMQTDGRVYAVKGISEPISQVLQSKIPITIEAVLLPFKDKIIYDSIMNPHPFDLGDLLSNMFIEIYEKAIRKGIITRFDDTSNTPTIGLENWVE